MWERAARDVRWYVWWLAIGAAFSIPFSVFAYLTPRVEFAVVALSIGVIGSYAYAGAAHAVAQSLARPRMPAAA